MKKVGIISLGCSRNLVDSEIILGSLKEGGFKISDVEKGVDILVVNTCAFIQSARAESVDAILQASQLKKEGKARLLIVCGCMPQLYKEKLLKELPEVDLIVGTNDFFKIKDLVRNLGEDKGSSAVSDDLSYLYDEKSPRFSLVPAHYVYVKISEGCSNFCTYCIISRLRGHFRSRPMESIIEEARGLSKTGKLREINLVGQDTTQYGIDRYGKLMFSELLRQICALKNNVKWTRLLYTHPAHYANDMIETIRDEEKICKYLDLPIQHISDGVLERMNRRTTKKEIIELIDKLRKNIPDIVLRTSIIVGFPGESEKDFKELLEFLREAKFERLGAFIYSNEEGTKAAGFKNHLSEKIKKDRFDELMRLQQGISIDINNSFLNKTIEVLIDERVDGESNKFVGRTQGDAPEVDGLVYVAGNNLKIGEFYKVKITDTLEYDLVGEAA